MRLPYMSTLAERTLALLAPVAHLHERLARERPHRTNASSGCLAEALALLARVAGLHERSVAQKAVNWFVRHEKGLIICAHEVPHK